VISCATSPSTTISVASENEIAPDILEQVQSIDSWTLGFEYQNTTVEEKTENQIVTEIIIKNHGQSDFNIAMRDNIIETTNKRIGSSLLNRVPSTESGRINMHIMRTISYAAIGGHQYNIRLFFKNKDGDPLFEKVLNKLYAGYEIQKLVADVADLIIMSLN
jgi:hypothetical protein